MRSDNIQLLHKLPTGKVSSHSESYTYWNSGEEQAWHAKHVHSGKRKEVFSLLFEVHGDFTLTNRNTTFFLWCPK
jgi:hypothetical protein